MSIEIERPVTIDWFVEERNTGWHETYFAPQALKDHQAKGSCRLLWHIIEHMEEKGWLNKGDTIFDFMCGIGSTLIVSALKGYDAFGIELEKKFVDDMKGYDDRLDLDSLFPLMPAHVEGNIEKFYRVTKELEKIGRIRVYQGDSRNIAEVLSGKPSINYWGHSQPVNIGPVICSPPYGNRLQDERQQFSSRDERTFSELGQETDDHQYSKAPENIGNSKINVICSPPYARNNEQNENQMEYLPNISTRPSIYENENNLAWMDTGEYGREIFKVYKSLFNTVPVGTHIALITRNFIQKKEIVYLDRLTISLMKQAGFEYIETKRAVLPDISFFKRLNHQKFFEDEGLPLIDWEEVTFYVRPDKPIKLSYYEELKQKAGITYIHTKPALLTKE